METLKNSIFFILIFFLLNSAHAEPINGNLVSLQVLDKVTSRLETIDIKVGDIVKYGSLHIEIFVCKKRHPEEVPEDFVLLRIYDEIKPNNLDRIFQGWMISSSPTVAPFEHPIYDVWVNDCKIVKDSK